MSIPLIDLSRFRHGGSSTRRGIAQAVDQTLHDNGFLLVGRHGISTDLMTSLLRVSHEFFALPLAEKMDVAQRDPKTMRGYVAVGRESLAHSRETTAPPDLNESFMMGQPDACKTDRRFPPNVWPDHPAEMKATWTEYYLQMESLAVDLMRMFAVSLGLAEEFFDRAFDAHTSRLRARHYPSQSEAPQPGQLRAGAHTDYGSLAILLTEDRPGGLQVRDRQGQWLDVPVADGNLIVNIGDLMARWTNDRWCAALHRVVNPPRHLGDSDRLSHIFFQSPGDDTLVQCLDVCCDASRPAKYSPVLAGEYLNAKFTKVRLRQEV